MRRIIAAAEPGTLLASERRLAGEFGISLGTVRRVMAQLVADGLIRKLHGKGNLVAGDAIPVDNSRGTIVFADPTLNTMHPFWGPRLRGIVETAQHLRYNLQIIAFRRDHEDHSQLLGTVCRPEVVGLIYPFGQAFFLKRVWEARPRLAVVLEQPSPHDLGPLATVMLDYANFGHNAIERLGYSGCRRPAAVCLHRETLAGAREAALSINAMQLHEISLPGIADAEAVALHQLAGLDYDGLIFDDDVIATEVLAGLTGPKRQVPVVSTANAGNAKQLPADVRRYEFDGFEAGRTQVAVLDNLIRENFLSGCRVMLPARPLKVGGVSAIP